MNTKHVVITKEGGEVKIYVDGKIQAFNDGAYIEFWTFDEDQKALLKPSKE